MINKKDIDELFPFHKKNGLPSYRKNQYESIQNGLRCLIEQGYNSYYLDCPVGFGKSAALVTIARYLDRMYEDTSYYSTPYKTLQDQLKKDHREIPQIKGRNNYTCLSNPLVSCEDGACQYKSKTKYKCPNKENCKYNRAKERCSSAPITCANVSYLMSLRKSGSEDIAFGNRKLLIVDEAHSIPEWGVNFVSATVYENKNITIPNYEDNFPKHVTWIKDEVLPSLDESRQALFLSLYNKEDTLSFKQKLSKYKWLKQTIRNIKAMVKDYKNRDEDWIYDISTTEKGGRKITYQPLKSASFLNKLLFNYGSKKIFSSATIDPLSYIEEGGLQFEEFKYKDCVFSVPSEFDPKKSPIYYKPLGKLTMTEKSVTFPKIIAEMNKVIYDRKDRKGIIHTFSYNNAEYILDNINPKVRPLLVMQDRDNREDSLNSWMESVKPSVFVSTKMTEGLNLANDLSRYQIYIKMGFPNIKNKRVEKRLSLGHWLWYYNLVISDVEQASGRDVRSLNDWSELFIYDSSFETILQRYRTKLKHWFLKRIIRVSNGRPV